MAKNFGLSHHLIVTNLGFAFAEGKLKVLGALHDKEPVDIRRVAQIYVTSGLYEMVLDYISFLLPKSK